MAPAALAVAPAGATPSTTSVTSAALSVPAAAAPSPSPLLEAVTTVADWVLNPAMNTDPQAPPVDSPLSWTVLAAARRQVGQTSEAPIQASADALTSQASTLPATPHLLGGKATVTNPSAGNV